MKTLSSNLLRPALSLFVLLTLVTGFAYPGAVTLAARALFPAQAEGSWVKVEGRVVGSALVGQSFTDPAYVWGRPSATANAPYDAANSGGSNLGPTNPALVEAVQGRITALRAVDPEAPVPIPIDLVTASGSGLDPHVSIAGARWQAGRVARARGVPRATVEALIDAHAEGRWLGWLGEPRVNVLALNLALDRQAPKRQ